MDSFIPCVTGPHAVETAVRRASASEVPEAFAQFCFPANSTHASQSSFCAESVDHSRKQAKIAATTMPISVPRFMTLLGSEGTLGRMCYRVVCEVGCQFSD